MESGTKSLFLNVLLAFLLAMFLWTNGARAATVTIEFIGKGSSIPYHGVYAGMYEVLIDGEQDFVMCDDFTARIHPGDTWEAKEYVYAGIRRNAQPKFSGKEKYGEVGWLFAQAIPATPAVRAQIQGAIWNIMTPGSVAMDPLAQSYYNQATDGTHGDFNYKNVITVLTPHPYIAGQEFLRPVTAVPIPSGILLLGSGMIAIGGFIRRRKN